MNIFFENDVVLLRRHVKANIIGGGEIVIPGGTVGTVLMVYDDSKACEVEFFISERNEFALATVDARSVINV